METFIKYVHEKTISRTLSYRASAEKCMEKIFKINEADAPISPLKAYVMDVPLRLSKLRPLCWSVEKLTTDR